MEKVNMHKQMKNLAQKWKLRETETEMCIRNEEFHSTKVNIGLETNNKNCEFKENKKYPK